MSEGIKPVGDWITQFGGWLAALVAAIGAIIFNSRKVKVDESAVLLTSWKVMHDTHKADMTGLKADMTADRKRHGEELSAVRRELKDLQTEFSDYRKQSEANAIQLRKESLEQLSARDTEIAGLKRTISQISQSTAVQIGDVREKVQETDEAADEREADNSAEHEAIKENLERLNHGIGDNSVGRDMDEGDRE